MRTCLRTAARSKIAILLTLLLLISLFPVDSVRFLIQPVSAAGSNLPNAGFEETALGKPLEWTVTSGSAVSSEEQVHTGSKSVKLTDPSNTTTTRLRSANMSVTAGKDYEASVFSYNLQGTSALFVEFWDASGNSLGYHYSSHTGLNHWEEIKVYGQTPALATEVSLRLYLHQTNVGTAYFDDASFRLLPELIPLLNGDLEQVTGTMPSQWSSVGGTATSVEEKAHGGAKSVKMVDSSSTLSAAVRSVGISIVPGVQYEASVYSYNTQGSSQLYLEFLDASNNYILPILIGSNTTLNKWEQIKVVGTAPEGAVKARLRFYLHGSNIGTAYFDDASFGAVITSSNPNLLNGTFELLTGGKPRYWNEVDGTIDITSAPVHSGENSVKITDGGANDQAGLRSHLIPIDGGADYSAKVYANSASGFAELRLEVWDANLNLLRTSTAEGSTQNTWESLTAKVTAPANGAYVSLRVGVGRDQAGVAYFDDASIQRTSAFTNSKTRSTLYTPDKITAARTNVQQYDWAETMLDDAVSKADHYLTNGLEFIWNSVPAQTLPRSYGVNQQMGSPITGRDIDQYGNYPYTADPLGDPWKIVDPSSGYKFPTNDFGAYYASGLDDHGIFQPELADRGLLVNTLYPEKGPTWGVDDGFGWVDDQGKRYTFVAYYVHWFLWYSTGFIQDGLKAFRDAYLYTGDMKYARAGAVLLDRIADVYPELDISAFNRTLYLNSHGGTGRGKAVGAIWEAALVKDFISAYDAFYPAMGDSQIITFLSAKSQQYRMINAKNTGAAVRRNIEDGIIKQIYPAVRAADIRGNDGMHQSTLAMAAVVYDTLPSTRDWLDFVFQTGGLLTNPYRTTGGNVLNSLVSNVDRDGNGSEAAPGYNSLWLAQHQITADILDGYDLYPEADLYQNVKFRKLFSGLIPLTLSEAYTANIGDSGFTGNPLLYVRKTDMIKAYDKFGDPIFAQMAYFLNFNRADGIHKDIFSNNPEDIADLISNVIDVNGPLNLKSDNLSGYGFTALRDGVNVQSNFGLTYDFPSLAVTANNTAYKIFAESGTVQLEAVSSGGAITFNFQVPQTDVYDLDLLPLKATSYGSYRIYIDGVAVKDVDFFGYRTELFGTIATLALTAGTHQITFEGIGKNTASSSYKMGVRKLSLLNAQDRADRDQANLESDTLRDYWMYYGRNSVHGHRDTLNLGMHAFGLDLAPDLGYPEFADSNDKHRHQWVNNTISHNTVVVDKRKQEDHWVAEPKHFDDTERVKLIDVEASDVYPQIDQYRRTTVMIAVYNSASYAVDFFRVKGGSDHYFSFHGAEGTVATDGLIMTEQPTGTYAGPNVDYGVRVDDVDGRNYMGSGFHYLRNVSRDTSPSDTFSVDWNVVDT
ncbi:MAG: bacterial Ig-like protein, partial [Paenibacillus sp.]|nr:bacterial Ig-like protein [Paenibacillus sp.]